ncbi:hypothetical protein KMT30_24390 [Streptomyces sp. IBSBF 2953]|nr:hypothetical protein [Streptomyces hayashii]
MSARPAPARRASNATTDRPPGRAMAPVRAEREAAEGRRDADVDSSPLAAGRRGMRHAPRAVVLP